MWMPDPDADGPRWRAELCLAGLGGREREGALRLAVGLGVLDEAQAEAWRGRAALAGVRQGAAVFAEWMRQERGQASPAEHAGPPPQTTYAPVPDAELVDVWIGPPAVGGARIIELRRYTTAVQVIAERPFDAALDDDGPWPDVVAGLTLSDDLGTPYRRLSASRDHAGDRVLQSCAFRPAPPPEAAVIRVAVGAAAMEVALR